jgi:hypothetical protein
MVGWYRPLGALADWTAESICWSTTDLRASKTLGSCMNVVRNIDWCLQGVGFVNPREMAHTLVARDRDTVVLWGLMVGPIIICWLIGDVAFTIVRWIR